MPCRPAIASMSVGRAWTIIWLQPFLFYEGLLNRHEHELRIAKLKLWFKVIKIFDTDSIQIPTHFLQQGTLGDIVLTVMDQIEVTDLGLQETSPIVQRVNRPNSGCCLGTFNIAGRIWANRASSTGMISDNADGYLRVSLERLRNKIDIEKVFYVQVLARMSWSRNVRLFVYENDRVILNDLGFDGWESIELFSRTLSDPSKTVTRDHAQRGIAAWKRLKSELNLFITPKESLVGTSEIDHKILIGSMKPV
ncbi:hypothetical protein BGW36DRAFT_392865 [Talaromyces proteolyticus]|uniref:Uncharacterized protein n=1 Tax=Talaromyces proteolyticus TaxID=1131652 RepID=A0AAD4Q602_9EURO|nr:uncharacterized protein BGW36DRAFT_392865 [Talaromyces proteolyticus]KAH8705176.1 hypothetical protein BGW36DRAFT_392865 [Talaromyces proteolyticus]